MMRAVACVLVAAAVLAGCARTRLLVHHSLDNSRGVTSTQTTSSVSAAPSAVSPRRYVAQLQAEERTLAAAERRIPANASTPRALARSASLLADAVARLERGLAAITPPPKVASEHAHLVAVVGAYAAQLRRAAALARRPGGQLQAGPLLISATNRASAAFSLTLSKIYSTLGVAQP